MTDDKWQMKDKSKETQCGRWEGMRSFAIVICLFAFLAGMTLGGEPGEESLRGDGIDHIILLPVGGEPARFVGPELRVREIRWMASAVGADAAPVPGKLIFGDKSALQKKLRELLEAKREFEMVVYHLLEGKLHRLRFQGVKLTRGSKMAFEWTAVASQAEPVEGDC